MRGWWKSNLLFIHRLIGRKRPVKPTLSSRPSGERQLATTEDNAAFCSGRGRSVNGHFVARQDADAVLTHFTGDVQ